MGRSNLGGLSKEGENLSRGQQLWFGLIVLQYSFLCVVFFLSYSNKASVFEKLSR